MSTKYYLGFKKRERKTRLIVYKKEIKEDENKNNEHHLRDR